jgi:hypothetical protein
MGLPVREKAVRVVGHRNSLILLTGIIFAPIPRALP